MWDMQLEHYIALSYALGVAHGAKLRGVIGRGGILTPPPYSTKRKT